MPICLTFRSYTSIFFTCLALVVISAKASPATGAEFDSTLQGKIESLINEKLESQGIPGLSAAVALDGQVVYSRGFGLADVENDVPVTADTAFRTASIAKTFTAVAVMQLVEQGKIDLDQPVNEFYSGYPSKKWPITTRQLLGHLAGVRHYKSSRESYLTRHFGSVQAGIRTFADDPLEHEPGTKFLYSSFGYNLLGGLVENASGKRFTDYLAEAVVAPSEMTRTEQDNHFKIIPNRSRGYVRFSRQNSRKFSREVRSSFRRGKLYNAPLHDTSAKVPGGGMVSTAPDLVRFASALMEGKLVGIDSLTTMWTQQKTTDGTATEYGLGFRILESNGLKVVGHSGGQSGVTTWMVLCPENGTSVALMCNLQNAELKELVLDILAEVTSVQAIPVSAPAKESEMDYEAIAQKIIEFVKYERKQKDLAAVSISLVDDQEVVWSAGFGPQDRDGKIPATGDTIYRAGSVSKLFTDLAVMKLVGEGKLDLDADVRQYLPDFKPENPYDIPITLRMLMGHRSGLVREPPVGNYFDPTEPSLEATVMSLNDTKLVYKPNTRTKYSNAAIAVVGLVVEKTVGKPFVDYMQEEFLEPMEMHSSSFEMTPKINDRLAAAWMWSHHGPRFEPPVWQLGTIPAGSLFASTKDLGNFLKTIFAGGTYGDRRVLPAEQVAAMLKPAPGTENDAYRFGVGFKLGELDGHPTFGHGGAIYGYSTQFTGLQNEKLGVATVSAVDVSNGFSTRLADYALRLMLAAKKGEPLPEIDRTKPLEKGVAQKIEGQYQSGDSVIETYEFDNKLFLKDGFTTREVRAGKAGLVVDDVMGYGSKLSPASDHQSITLRGKEFKRLADTLPPSCPDRWRGLIGEYGWDHNTLYIYEDRGQLWALIEWFYYYPLTEIEENVFAFPESGGLYHGEKLFFTRNEKGKATKVEAAEVVFDRRLAGIDDGDVFQITPIRPVEELRRDALLAKPPAEPQDFRESDLVELNDFDKTIKLDIRYASDRNFMGTPFYVSSHAFAQRPAAKAVVEANKQLAKQGYGLLIHDAYRPWFVTKMFWDGTPADMHDFVADPEQGSRHNRGCAVDLTLYDLKTGEPIKMVAGYDEFSPRSFPLYPGGTSQERWHRRLLRNTMEAAGFTIYEFEWWHFDYKAWREYPIGNQRFEELLEKE